MYDYNSISIAVATHPAASGIAAANRLASIVDTKSTFDEDAKLQQSAAAFAQQPAGIGKFI